MGNHMTTIIGAISRGLNIWVIQLVGSQQLEYDSQFNQLIKFTDSNNNVTSYELDDSGNIAKQIQGEGTIEELVVTYTYNQQGQVATITDELNRVTKYSYYDGGSEQGLLQKIEFPDETTNSICL